MSYKRAREKLETVGVENPERLLELMQAQAMSWEEMGNQIQDMDLLKTERSVLLSDLLEDLHGTRYNTNGRNDMGEDFDLLAENLIIPPLSAQSVSHAEPGERNFVGLIDPEAAAAQQAEFAEQAEIAATTAAVTAAAASSSSLNVIKKRMTKQERIELGIHDADKKLEHSRDRLRKTLGLMADVKAGLLHLTKLLRLGSIHRELEETGEDDDEEDTRGKRRGSSGCGSGKISDVVKDVLDVVEDKLGQMVDMVNVVRQSKATRTRRKQVRKMSMKTRKKLYWEPDNDPTLLPSPANARSVGTPEYGEEGLVLPRRPVSRIVSMRMRSYDNGQEMLQRSAGREGGGGGSIGGESDAAAASECGRVLDDEEMWWRDELDGTRAKRLEAKKKKKREESMAQRRQEERVRRQKMEYDAALAEQTAKKQAMIDERREKKEKAKQKKVNELERKEKEKQARIRKKKEEHERIKKERLARLVRPGGKKRKKKRY